MRVVIAGHNVKENTGKRFQIKEANAAMGQASEAKESNKAKNIIEQLLDEDQLTIRMHTMTSRGPGLTENEKAFIIFELRKAQRNAQSAPNSHTIATIISKGQDAGILRPVAGDEKKYYGQVRNFLRNFLKLGPIGIEENAN